MGLATTAILLASLAPLAQAQTVYDLAITKEDTPDPVEVGQNIHYFVNVTNAGTIAATLVSMNDTLPAGVTFVSVTPSTGCTTDPGFVNCTIAALAAGTTANFEIVVRADEAGEVVNVATTSSPVAERNGGNNRARASTLVVTSPADLHVNKTDEVDPVVLGGDITYHVNVSNEGGSPATNVVVSDTLPAGTTFVSVTPSAGCSGPVAGVLSCSIGTLAAGAWYDLEIVVSAGSIGVKTNTASATTEEFERDTQDNSDSEDTLVVPAPLVDLAITKDDVADPVFVGQNITYLINVTNVGTTAAENVTITDTLPAGVTLLSVTPPTGCSRSPGQFTCNIGTLAPSATYRLVVNVSADTAGDKVNGVRVDPTAPQVDPDRSNNAQRERTTVLTRAPSDLACVAQPEEVILVSWSAVAGATGYNVYRAVGGGSFAFVATTAGTSYQDTNTTVDETYSYYVTALSTAGESLPSEPCSATAIPFFPSAIAMAVAVVGLTATVAVLRRKRSG